MPKWVTPKTDWTAQDFFNLSDYQRIAGNLIFLHWRALPLYPALGASAWQTPETLEMGAVMDWTRAAVIETDTMLLADSTFRPSGWEELDRHTADVGANAPAWSWAELNVIERNIARLRTVLYTQKSGLPRLAFELGGVQFG